LSAKGHGKLRTNSGRRVREERWDVPFFEERGPLPKIGVYFTTKITHIIIIVCPVSFLLSFLFSLDADRDERERGKLRGGLCLHRQLHCWRGSLGSPPRVRQGWVHRELCVARVYHLRGGSKMREKEERRREEGEKRKEQRRRAKSKEKRDEKRKCEEQRNEHQRRKEKHKSTCFPLRC